MESGELEAWLEARCFDPEAAEDMDEVGVTPDMASVRTDAGSGGYVDTVGYKVAAGDLELEEACALLGIDASTVPDPFASDTPTGSLGPTVVTTDGVDGSSRCVRVVLSLAWAV
jgi:hypothetical protein